MPGTLSAMPARIKNSLTYRGRQLFRELEFALRRTFKPLVEVHGLKVPLGRHLSLKVLMLLDKGYYESAEMELLKKYLNPEDRVMEIGAGIGFLSTYCARITGSDKVVAFEANPNLEGPIRKMYRLNDVRPELHICMLGPKAGENVLHLHRDLICSSSNAGSGHRRCVTVPVRSFSEELSRFQPTFLIVDIEGGEFDLLVGQPLEGVTTLMLEVHPHILGAEKLQQIRDWLCSQQFRQRDGSQDVEVYTR